jgi:hypothetical protein
MSRPKKTKSGIAVGIRVRILVMVGALFAAVGCGTSVSGPSEGGVDGAGEGDGAADARRPCEPFPSCCPSGLSLCFAHDPTECVCAPKNEDM